jgi:hypothetical protein
MAEKVVVKGGGTLDGAQFDNAASEATLQELLKVMKGFNTGGGSGGGAGGNTAGNKVQSLYTRLLGTSNDELEKNSSALSSSTSAIKSFAGGVLSAAGAGIGAVFGAAVTAGQGLVKFLLEGTSNFQKLSSVGAGFNGDIQAIAKAASSSGMSMEAFTELVTKNNTALVALGGSAQAGAIKIGQVSKELTEGQIGDKLFGLGLTVSDINDYMGSYLEQQARLGGLNKKGEKEIAQGNAIYAEELEKVIKLTGANRKDLEKQAQKLALDPLINKLMSSINRSTEAGEKQYQKGVANMAAAAEIGGDELQDALKAIAVGSIGDNKLAQAIASRAGITQKMAEEFVTGQREIGPMMNQIQGGLNGMVENANAGQIKNSEYLMESQKLVLRMRKYGDLEEVQKRQDMAAQKNTAGQIAQLGTLFSKIYNQILNKVVGSDAFTKLMKFIEEVATAFKENKGGIFDLIDTLSNGLGEAFDKMLAAFKSGGLVAALKTGFDEIFKLGSSAFKSNDLLINLKTGFESLISSLTPIVAGLFKTLFSAAFQSPEDKKKKDELQAKRTSVQEGLKNGTISEASGDRQLADIQNQLDSMNSKSPIEIMIEGIKSALADTFPKVTAFFNFISDFADKPLSAGLDAFKWALDNIGTILAVGGGVIAGMYILSAALGGVGGALTAVLTPVSLVLAAFGLAAGGLGYMFEGISKVVNSFVEGFKSIPVVLGQLAELDSNKLKGIASAMGDISGALSKLAGGGILTSLFGTGGLPDFIKSAKELENINSDAIRNTVSAVSSVKGIGSDLGKQAEGVKTFADSIKNLTDRIKELQVSLEKLNKTPGGTSATASAAASTTGTNTSTSSSSGGESATSSTSDKLEKLNILMTELVSINKEIRGFEKDQVDAIKGRNSAMGGK